VVDPVLLLSKEIYENLSEVSEFKPSSNSYVYIYALGINSKSQIQWNIIKQFARERSLNIKITPIQGGEHLFNNIFKVFPSPKAWLQLIKNADYVITNSFHGTLFSIIMEKHFIVIPKNKKDNRFSSLLSKLALNDRILETGSIQELKSIFDTNINWEEVNKRKNLFIEKSKEFIRSWENL